VEADEEREAARRRLFVERGRGREGGFGVGGRRFRGLDFGEGEQSTGRETSHW
jgi:hypothetical protein